MARDRTKLLHHSQSIKEPLEFRDLAGSQAVEDGAGHCDLSPGRCHPLKLAPVGASTRPALGNPRPFGQQLFGRGIPIGERPSQADGKGFEVIETDVPPSRENDRRVETCKLGRNLP